MTALISFLTAFVVALGNTAQDESQSIVEALRPSERTVWDDLADCESGDWVNGGESFIEGSARWHMRPGELHSHIFEGGLQFHPDTWDWLRPDDFPDNAADASKEQQIYVAERVLEIQGWAAWPVCSRKLGLR